MTETERQIEQYIYSRADRSFTHHGISVGLGYGFLDLSSGMDKKLKDVVGVYCNQFPRGGAISGDLRSLPVFQKVYLPQVGRLMLQRNVFLSPNNLTSNKRGFHVAHGYLVPKELPDIVQPLKYFMLKYVKGDPNEVEGGINREKPGKFDLDIKLISEILPFRQTMQTIGLEKDGLIQLLLACFDALADDTQILIACDFRSADWENTCCMVMYWLFTCLPNELKLKLGVDSIYTEASIPGATHIAFVDKSVIELSSGDASRISVKIDRDAEPLRKKFLLVGNQLFYNPNYKRHWLGRSSLFINWLKYVVDSLWEKNPGWTDNKDNSPLPQAYGKMQEMLEAIPEEQRLDPEQYDVACWQLVQKPEGFLAEVAEKVCRETTKEQSQHYNRIAISSGMGKTLDWETVESTIAAVLNNPQAPIDQAYIQLLGKWIVSKETSGSVKENALKYLDTFIKTDLNAPDADVVLTLEKYKEVVDGKCFTYLLDCTLFHNPSKEDAWKLRDKWYREKLSAYCNLESALQCPAFIESELKKLLEPFNQDKLYPSFLEKTKIEMADVWVSMLREQIGKDSVKDSPAETISLQDVLAFVKAVTPYQSDKMWEGISKVAEDMTKICQVWNSAGLEELQEIQAVFQEVKNDKIFTKCQCILLRKEYKRIRESGGLRGVGVSPSEHLTDRLSEIGNGIPKDASKEAKVELQQYVNEMFVDAYDLLLYTDTLLPFINAEWLKREITSCSHRKKALEGAERLLYVLAKVADDPNAPIVNLERSFNLTIGEKETCDIRLIELYVNSLIPHLGDNIIAHLMHVYSEHRRRLLECLVERSGGNGLLRLLKYNRENRQAAPYGGSNDFVATLQDVSDDELLDCVNASPQDQNFDETLIDFIIDSVKGKDIDKETARRITSKVYQHYESCYKPNRALKRKAEKLEKDAGGGGLIDLIWGSKKNKQNERGGW